MEIPYFLYLFHGHVYFIMENTIVKLTGESCNGIRFPFTSVSWKSMVFSVILEQSR